MKKKSIIIIAVLFISITSFLSAQELTLDYLEGYLDVKEQGEWVELFTGDPIPRDATVRLDEDSLAEISGMNMNFTLTRPGVYNIGDMLSTRTTMNSTGLGSIVSGKVSSLFSERASGPDTVGGVRAAEVETEPSIDWMTSEAADMISQAKDMITEGDYAGAMDLLEEAFDFAADEYEEQEISFYRGYVYMVTGKSGKALKEFSNIDPSSDQPYYDDLFLLKGKLLVDSFAFGEAVDWFSGYTTQPVTGEKVSTQQSIYLLYGVAAKEQGLEDKADGLLKKAIKLDPGSDIAAVASSILEQ